MSHGGLAEILKTGQAPGVKTAWPLKGRYVSGLAEYSGDPKGWCSTKHEVVEKARKQGKAILEDCT
jgi:hypothetical protein